MDGVDNKTGLYCQHRNYFRHQSQYPDHLKQIQILQQVHVVLLDLQFMHHKDHEQYVPQLDEHDNDKDVIQQVQHRIHK